MKNLKVIAFTHKQVDLKDLGNLVICDEELETRLMALKNAFDIPEIFYIGTCNRVEFVFYGPHQLSSEFVLSFLRSLNFCVPDEALASYISQATTYEGADALNHLMRVSCSIDSLVVGEKEILAQVRKAYEQCRVKGFTGDFMRMLMDCLVKTAKEVYTQTRISRNPVSIVSLAYRKLRDSHLQENPHFLIIGAGETNQNLAKYIQKHKNARFTVFNRSLDRAKKLAEELGGEAFPLEALRTYNQGFDVLITCTGATESLIDGALYEQILGGSTERKIVIDLAVPNDIDAEVVEHFPMVYIEVRGLQAVAQKNLQERYNELIHAERILESNRAEFLPLLKQRQVELAMSAVPQKVKEIKSFAINTVFAKEIDTLDMESKAVLEKVVNYMEKKYISVPMIMAKEILTENTQNLVKEGASVIGK